MADTDAPLPWERQPDETHAAYSAFTIYRDMNPDERSIHAAYRIRLRNLGREPDSSKRATGAWCLWSTRNKWVARAQAYDLYLDEVRRKRRKRQLERAQDEIVSTVRGAMQPVIRRLQTINPDEIPVDKIPQFIKVLGELELKALGHADRTELTGADGGPVEHVFAVEWEDFVESEDEELDDLRAAGLDQE